MVNVADSAHVYVGLLTLKLLFGHASPLLYVTSRFVNVATLGIPRFAIL
jgi:hypothetical protein